MTRPNRRRIGLLSSVVLACLLGALAAAPSWALDPQKEIGHYIVDHWDTANSGIPMNAVRCLLQSRDGYLWIGTYEGLCRFDGLRFTVFDKSNTPAIQNNSMRFMSEGPDGELWIGTAHGLLCQRGGRFRNYTEADGLAGDLIMSLCFDARGVLWVGSTTGLSRWQNGSFARFRDANGVDPGYVWALCPSRDGSLWVGTESGLLRLDSGRFSSQALPGAKSGIAIWSLLETRDGTLWIGTAGSGLFSFSLRQGAFRRYGPAEGIGDRVRTLYEDRFGTLWVGTDDLGLKRFRNGSFATLGKADGLGDDSVRALLEDHEGSLWVGTNSGLNRLKDERYFFYNSRNGLPVDLIRSVFQDSRGDFWIGTIDGGLVRFSAGRFQGFGTREGVRNLRVWSIAEGRDGAIWFGTYGGGLHRLKDGKIRVWSTANGLANDIVRAVLAAADGSVWVGSNGGGVDILHPDGRIVNFSRRNGLGDDFIYAIAQDREGAVWVGAYNGDLYRFRGEEIATFRFYDRFTQNAIWTIYPDPDGALWIGTNSSGLIRFKDGNFRAITTRDGLYNDVAFQILEDNRGFLWMQCNKGIFCVDKKELNDFAAGRSRRVRSLSFGIPEGVRGIESTGPAQPAGWKARDGRLWFPTINGVAVVDPDYRKRNELMPPVAIEKMTVDGRDVGLTPPLVFGPGRKRLEFTYTALSYLVPERVRFKTWLSGFDRGWSTETSQRQVSYTNLPPGDYVFRVIGCNNDGKWNEVGARLAFELRPFFYQTAWFWILSALLALLLAVAAVRWRFRSLERRKRELEVQVGERTVELSRVNEELLQANRMQAELQRIAVHDLKNPLQAIMGMAGLIQRRDRELPGGDMLAEKISLASRRMLALVNEMLEISRFERGEFKLELQTVDIGRLVELSAAGFAGQMLHKGQTLALELEPGGVVMGDLEWLKEIFDNLLSNAVKFSPFKARITVSAQCVGERVRVGVQDQGPGLSEEDKGKLFGKFQRLSAKPTGGESSTGLGLSIAELLVRKHGGRIWAESEPGCGSTFFVELPRA